MSLIKFQSVSRYYGHDDAKTIALDDITLTIESGEFVAIMGKSGSGKSTLMNIIGMLDGLSEGTYTFDEVDVSGFKDSKRAYIRQNKIGFIFQSFNLLQRHTAIDNVALPMVYAKLNRFSRDKRAAGLLRKVGLEDRVYHFPNELSGGQMQRVAIARALANKPNIILADEPTGNLDTESGANIMTLLQGLNAAGNTIIMVTHDPDIAKLASRIINLRDGKLVDDSLTKPAASTKRADSKESVAEQEPEKPTKTNKQTNSKAKDKKKSKFKTSTKKKSKTKQKHGGKSWSSKAFV